MKQEVENKTKKNKRKCHFNNRTEELKDLKEKELATRSKKKTKEGNVPFITNRKTKDLKERKKERN
jgi:hypothetical protein